MRSGAIVGMPARLALELAIALEVRQFESSPDSRAPATIQPQATSLAAAYIARIAIASGGGLASVASGHIGRVVARVWRVAIQ